MLLILVAMLTVVNLADGCSVIAVGKNASTDGSVLVAHTDDAGDSTIDFRLVIVPAFDYEPKAARPVYHWVDGYPRIVSDGRGPAYLPDKNQSVFIPMGYIPQVSHTYSYFDTQYAIVNEHQLTMAESSCGARTAGWNVHNGGKNLFGIEELTKIAMERCVTARCAIQTMGDLASQYGFYSADVGLPLNDPNPDLTDAGECLSIADKTGEVWVFHILTGPDNGGAVWAAQRLEDDQVTVISNGYIIRKLDLKNTEMFMASTNVISFAESMGWFDSTKDKNFDFTRTYGYQPVSPKYSLYLGRRTWRAFSLLAPSQIFDDKIGYVTASPSYPFSITPDKKVELSDIKRIFRDHFENTPYDLTQGMAAGPFGSPVRYLNQDTFGVQGGWERPFSIFRSFFSYIAVIHPNRDDAIGATLWFGLDAPHGTAYVPFYSSQRKIPSSYSTGKQTEFSMDCAWWAFNFLNNWSQLRFNRINADVRGYSAVLEDEGAVVEAVMYEEAMKLLQKNMTTDAREMVEQTANKHASYVIDNWWKFAFKMVAKFSNGRVVTGEGADQSESPGYPEWWLKIVSWHNWPGSGWTPTAGWTPLAAYVTIDPSSGFSTFSTLVLCGVFAVAVFVGFFYFHGYHYLRQYKRRWFNEYATIRDH